MIELGVIALVLGALVALTSRGLDLFETFTSGFMVTMIVAVVVLAFVVASMDALTVRVFDVNGLVWVCVAPVIGFASVKLAKLLARRHVTHS